MSNAVFSTQRLVSLFVMEREIDARNPATTHHT